MYYIFFIHLSINGHLHCFNTLTIMDYSAITWGCEGRCRQDTDFISSGFISRKMAISIKWPNDPSIFFSMFWGKPILHSIKTVSIYVPTNNIQGFLFLHILANTCYHCLLDSSHSSWHGVIPYCGFNFCFLYDCWCWLAFSLTTWQKTCTWISILERAKMF
jgi:hypothetical protein